MNYINYKNKNGKFEELTVWQLSRDLFNQTADIFYNKTFHNYSFQDQFMRAVISVSNNIAEGYERGSKKDFMRFLYISKGSCGEVRNMLYLAKDKGYIAEEQFETLSKLCVSISVKLSNFITAITKQL